LKIAGFESLLMQSNNPTEAVRAYRSAVEVGPNHFGAHLKLGRALLRLNRVSQAVEALEEAVRIRPGSDRAQHALEDARSRG
jgi:cytochrome c-type biogenesis protein CcmH/NrfG